MSNTSSSLTVIVVKIFTFQLKDRDKMNFGRFYGRLDCENADTVRYSTVLYCTVFLDTFRPVPLFDEGSSR